MDRLNVQNAAGVMHKGPLNAIAEIETSRPRFFTGSDVCWMPKVTLWSKAEFRVDLREGKMLNPISVSVHT